MPHVSVKLYAGRTEAQKAQLAEAIAQNVIDIVQCKKKSVSVTIEDINPDDWKEAVYIPDIKNQEDKLYIEPGYAM